MKRIAILGSTGSIGRSTLAIIRHYPDRFRVVSLSTHSNVGLLQRQIEEFRPRQVCVADEKKAGRLKRDKNARPRVYAGEEGLLALIAETQADEVVVAISGSGAFAPLIKAIEGKKAIVLANKEALVMAGPLIMRKAGQNKVLIKPVDSEQSAIWQCLDDKGTKDLKKIHLTASGGPFLNRSMRSLKRISVRDALRHPRWRMGKKISVDSATLMNKGLEVLEAMYLFGVPQDKIAVVIHPEAIVHSMVEFIDGVIMAQLSVTDMRIPIQYALTYPKRLACDSLPSVNFFRLGKLRFQKPDVLKFPCLALAFRVAKEGGTAPCVLSTANEVSVEAFLRGEVDFISIPRVIEETLSRHRNIEHPVLGDIVAARTWAEEQARRFIDRRG